MSKLVKSAKHDSLPDSREGVKVEADVVQRAERRIKDLAARVKVPQISPRIAPTDRTPTGFVGRARVVFVARVLDVQATLAGEELTIARIARRHDAIEHIDAAGDRVDNV